MNEPYTCHIMCDESISVLKTVAKLDWEYDLPESLLHRKVKTADDSDSHFSFLEMILNMIHLSIFRLPFVLTSICLGIP